MAYGFTGCGTERPDLLRDDTLVDASPTRIVYPAQEVLVWEDVPWLPGNLYAFDIPVGFTDWSPLVFDVEQRFSRPPGDTTSPRSVEYRIEDGVARLEFRRDSVDRVLVLVDSEPIGFVTTQRSTFRFDQLQQSTESRCIVLQQRNHAGMLGPPTEPVCITPVVAFTEPEGCSTLPTASWWSCLLLPLLARRR